MTATGGQSAGLARRLGASVYEALMLTALLLGLSFALLPFLTPAPGSERDLAHAGGGSRPHYLITPGARAWSATVLFGTCAAYCVGLWSGGRRTLPMKTWQLRLETCAGLAVAPRRALVRFLACWVGPALALTADIALQPAGGGRWALALLPVNYAWALVDPQRQFLQDRLARTRLTVDAARRG